MEKKGISRSEKPGIYFYDLLVEQLEQVNKSTWTMQERFFIDFLLKSVMDLRVQLIRPLFLLRRMAEIIDSGKADRRDVVSIVRSDPDLVLRVINTANELYREEKPSTSFEFSLLRLGIPNVLKLMSSVRASSTLDATGLDEKRLEKIWQRSLCTAMLAEKYAKTFKVYQDSAWIAGLCKDAGRLVMHRLLAEHYSKQDTKKDFRPTFISDLEELSHFLLGAEVLCAWKQDADVINAVEFQADQRYLAEPLGRLVFFAHRCALHLLEKEKVTLLTLLKDIRGIEEVSTLPQQTLQRELNDFHLAFTMEVRRVTH